MIQWGKVCGRWKNRKECMTAPITLSPLDPTTLAELRCAQPFLSRRTGWGAEADAARAGAKDHGNVGNRVVARD